MLDVLVSWCLLACARFVVSVGCDAVAVVSFRNGRVPSSLKSRGPAVERCRCRGDNSVAMTMVSFRNGWVLSLSFSQAKGPAVERCRGDGVAMPTGRQCKCVPRQPLHRASLCLGGGMGWGFPILPWLGLGLARPGLVCPGCFWLAGWRGRAGVPWFGGGWTFLCLSVGCEVCVP